jgi:hypothetical protein
VSGSIDVECGSNTVFVFGGARVIVRDLALKTRDGDRRPVSWARLPRGAGFRGRSFAVVARTRDLPARVVARGAGRRVLARIPRRSRFCPPGDSGGVSWAIVDFRSSPQGRTSTRPPLGRGIVDVRSPEPMAMSENRE